MTIKTKKNLKKNKRFSRYIKRNNSNIENIIDIIIRQIQLGQNMLNNIHRNLKTKIPLDLYNFLINEKNNTITNKKIRMNPKLLIFNKINKYRNFDTWIESKYQKDNKILVMLPGPAREMHPMFEEQVVPKCVVKLGDLFKFHKVGPTRSL